MGESDIKIELTIENTDLGFLTNAINNNDLMNSTDGDFLLIGTGSDIMSGNELLFYGRRKQAQKVVIPGGVAHVFFYSTESVFDATGFNITYNSTMAKLQRYLQEEHRCDGYGLPAQYVRNQQGYCCHICNEHPKISTPVYIAVPLTLVVLSIILTFAVCWYSKKSVFNESHIKYEKEQQERIEDARCRYSDTASILGLGLGEPSGGSVSSMPFSKPTRDDDDFEYKTEDFDMTEFREYDPDNVGLYMADIQLENVLGTQQPMRSYTNKAFVPDEEDTFYQKKSTFHNISDSESDDSDDGGVINLQESTRDQRQTHFIVPAEVHVGDDSGETVL